MKKSNILTITTIARTNESFLVEINRKLDMYNHYAAATDMTNSKSAEFYQDVFDLPIARQLSSILKIKEFSNQLINKIIEYNIDIVHVHTPVAAFMVRYSLRDRYIRDRLGIRIIYTAHGLHFFPGNSKLKNIFYAALEYIAGKWTDRLIVINKTDEASAKSLRLVDERKLIYMPGIGVNLDKYNNLLHIINKNKRPYFLVVAELIKRKRHRDILLALSKTPDDFELYLAGDGELVEELQQIASILGVSSRVHFLGHRSDIPELMQNSLGLILVSSQEGLPRSILEAMALGTLVIGSRIRGIVDLLEDGNGILVNVGDTEALSAEMMSISNGSQKYTKMIQAAKNKIRGYSLDRIVQMHRELYDQILTEKGMNQ